MMKSYMNSRVPPVGLGTYAFASQPSNGLDENDNQNAKTTEEIIYFALGHSNYRHIDTAHAYNNEKDIGRAIKRAMKDFGILRSELFICSKLWNEHHAPSDVFSALQNTLKNLGLEYLDLYLMHWPFAFKREHPNQFPEVIPKPEIDYLTDISPVQTWLAMEKLVNKGLVRHIGLSNFNSQQITEIMSAGTIRPLVNQVECHPYLNQEKLLTFCQEQEIQLIAYSPLGSPGRLWADKNEIKLLDDDAIKKIANAHNKTPAQVLLRWQIQRGVIVIPASRNKQRCKENIDIFGFILNDDDMKMINKMNLNRRLYVPIVDGKPWCSDHPHYPFNIEY